MDRDAAPRNTTFVKRKLTDDEDTPPSIPLAVPNNLIYDEHTNTLHKRDPSNVSEECYNDSGPLYAIPTSLELLRNIDKPVAVLSICGPYRSGKSYILSRILGVQDAFGVGHTMRQGTHGIWLATTALECDDFVVVFLDTEGTDQAGASDDAKMCNFSLVVLTVLISSTLIYNSMGVPKQSDLEAMSFFAQLSSMISPDHNQSAEFDFSNQFPKFHWLLRDVLLPPVDDDGELIPLTEYIKTNVLLSESSSSTSTQGIVNALLHLFPSFDCHMLPIPSNKRDVLIKITENESKLSGEFNKDVHDLRLALLNDVEPKKIMTSGDQQYINGPMLCQLFDVCLASLSTPEIIPDLTCGWLAVMRNRLERLLVKFSDDYLQEIDQALSGKGVIEESIPANFEAPPSPVDESLARIPEDGDESEVFETESRVSPEPGRPTSVSSRRSPLRRRTASLRSSVSSIITPLQVTSSRTLIGIHQSILDSKIKEFRKEINRSIGVVSEEEKSKWLSRLEKQIVQYDQTPEGNCSGCVVGGILYRYIKRNYEMSKERCCQTFDHIVEPLKRNLTRAVDSISDNYYTMAVGPAKDDVFEMKMTEFEENANRLSPGPPRNLRVVGLAHDKIKMKWSRPNQHPRAVKSYEIQIMLGLKKEERSDWKTIVTNTKKRAAVITNLTPSTPYLFRIRANNTNQIGEWSGEIEITTRMGKAARVGAATTGFVGGAIAAPFTQTAETFKQGIQAYRESETTSEKVQAGVGTVVGGLLLPFILISETLLNTTHTGVEIAEDVYKSTGTTVDDDFEESKAEVVSILPTDISSSSSSSSSGYNSNSNVSPTPSTNEQDLIHAEEDPLNQAKNEPNHLDGHMTTTEIESESTLTPKEASTRVESGQSTTLDSLEGEQCVHYQQNTTERDDENVDEISAQSHETDSVANKKRPTHLDTHAASQNVQHLAIASSNSFDDSAKIKLPVNSELQIDSPSPEENSLLCTLNSFAFSD